MSDKLMLFSADRYGGKKQLEKLRARWCAYCNGTARRLYHRVYKDGFTKLQWVPWGWYCTECQAVFAEHAA